MLEVEFKASLEGIDLPALEQTVARLGFLPRQHFCQKDAYYNAPDRNFMKTDEALRMRICTVLPQGPSQSLLTYKGPKLDKVSSVRREYEVAVSDGETACRLIEALGYTPVFTVTKDRRELQKEGVTLCLDRVEGLGPFLELEKLVPDGGCREEAERALLSLLDSLGVPRKNLTRTSYLEMLMRKG